MLNYRAIFILIKPLKDLLSILIQLNPNNLVFKLNLKSDLNLLNIHSRNHRHLPLSNLFHSNLVNHLILLTDLHYRRHPIFD